MIVVSYILTFVAGAVLGVCLMGFMVASSEFERREERQHAEREKHKNKLKDEEEDN